MRSRTWVAMVSEIPMNRNADMAHLWRTLVTTRYHDPPGMIYPLLASKLTALSRYLSVHGGS
jgi:hypothetical protein